MWRLPNLLDEPSAYLDSNQRMETAKTIRRVMEKEAKTGLIVDHDVYFLDLVSDSIMVFGGEPGVRGVGVTFRRDNETTGRGSTRRTRGSTGSRRALVSTTTRSRNEPRDDGWTSDCVGFHLSNRPVHARSRLMTLYKDLGRSQVDSYGENRRNRTIKDHRRRAGWRHPMELYTVGLAIVNGLRG